MAKNEDELKKAIYSGCDIRIQTGNNLKNNILQFFVTINLAFIGAVYLLKDITDDIPILIISCIIFFVNASLIIIFIREHNALIDNIDQQTKINNTIFDDYKNSKELDWYIFKDSFKDKYSALSYFVIISIFIFFDVIPIFILIFKSCNSISLLEIVIILLPITLITILLFMKNNIKEDSKKSNWNICNIIIKLTYLLFFIITLLYIILSITKLNVT